MRNAIIAGVAVLAMSAAPAFARARAQNTTATHTTDQTFVTKAGHANMAEIEFGRLAETKASSAEVKAFGKRMIEDHQKALDNLKTVAQKENITLPTTLDPKDQALKDRLGKLSGQAFDRAYMTAMVKDHQEDVAQFRAESRNAKKADIKEYASSTLPTLEGHLKLAESTDKAVVSTSGKKTSGR
jgi:putative membrane protein